MFKSETVFVLGAGASMPYGFPSGRDLVSMLGNTAGRLKQALCNLFREDEIDVFQQRVRLASPPSIDTFLEHQPDLVKIGKAGIAWALIQYESPDRLFSGGGKPQWYEFILNKMGCRPGQPCTKVTFITFNYDRSLDYFLRIALTNRFSEKDARKQMELTPIIHVHGQLGDLPWPDDMPNIRYRPYDTEINHQQIQAAASGIRIISEKKNDSVCDMAASAIHDATHIYFLGFGWHQDNLAAIKAPVATNANFRGGKIVGGTCYGLKDPERVALSKRLGIGRDFLGSTAFEIEDFLRHDASFLELTS